jgi:hypothetical protein
VGYLRCTPEEKKMSIAIALPTPPSAHCPQTATFTLGDSGNAHVDITLAIQGQMPIVNHFTYQGQQSTTVPLPAGTYNCTLVIQAFSYGALGAAYDSALLINGQPFASAKGSIAQGQTHDVGYASFTLIVP